jgi:hypothetical protein
MDPDEPPLSPDDERTLRFLRGLVTVLTGTMILGMGVLVVLFLTRFPQPDTVLAPPDTLDLPPGATVVSVSRGADWWAVATASGEVLVYDAETGALRQRLTLPPAE